MGITTFAAIDVGSYNVCMDIYEMSPRIGIRQIDEIRQRLEIGRDTYGKGKIAFDTASQLCHILKDFSHIMEEYQVENYRACATSTLQEAKNVWIVLEQVYQKTGIRVEILSNSEQRFFGYKSVAAKEESFTKMIQKGTAIVEVGGGNMQISLFDKDALLTTQRFMLGSLRVREILQPVEKETTHYEKMVEELVHNQILGFKKLHLKDRKIDNIILMGDSFMDKLFEDKQSMKENRTVSFEAFMEEYQWVVSHSPEEISVSLDVSLEYAEILIPAMIIYRVFAEELGAQTMWLPGTQLNDGISYDYAEKNRFIKSKHNFENDIIVSAKNIAKRYMSGKSHTQCVLKNALAIFDGMKKIHGMGPRERLLLQIAAILHDCGNFISSSNSSQCAYEIIMSTEIIGLSHAERELIANVVKFIKMPFEYYNEADSKAMIDRKDYMQVAKLTAIMRVANVLDRSHKQKVEEISASVKDQELIMRVSSKADLTLEKALLTEAADFFEEIFSIRPVLKRKKQK